MSASGNGQFNSPDAALGYKGAGYPQPSVNKSVRVIFAVTGVAQVVPGLYVEPQSTVRVRANNGTGAGNAQICRVGLSREDLIGTSGGDPMSPDDEIIYPVGNTGQLWAMGTAGDGITVSVRGNAT